MNTLLSSVNTTLNNSIGYRASPDAWVPADIGGTGDCKGIALGKQIRLSAAGFETALCTVATPSGEGHCVLCVKDGAEWWVLDNLTDDILRPTDTPYRWYLMQDGKRWRYVAWLRVFGRTIRLLGLKAPEPLGWADYLKRSATR
ncbi:MAG TPA: transglutaminase-like cysteine peptidase [Moraxellaceae bacterium]|nr:transglutaminase-like cysteine peptidase [Moraxellaceae bacterium]